jgi:hypothetical protein
MSNLLTLLQVYRGTLPTGQLIAIKRAQKESMQGGLEFVNGYFLQLFSLLAVLPADILSPAVLSASCPLC